MDQLASLKAFAKTNYTISAEIELMSTDGMSYELLEMVKEMQNNPSFRIKSAGTLYVIPTIVLPPNTC